MNYQKLTLIGNLTRDAERKTSKDGQTSYTTFRVAVSDAKECSIFFPIIVFGKQGEAIGEYLTKGREVLIEGRVEVSATGWMSVVADTVVLGSQPEKKLAGHEQAKRGLKAPTSAN